MTALQSARELTHGEHVCAFFDSPEQQRVLVRDFVCGGLQAGDRVWYVSDAVPADEVLSDLRTCGVPVERAYERGQLAVQSSEDSYLARLPFDPRRLVDAMKQAVEDALADGFRGLRVSGDLSWAARDVPGSERLLEYESRIGELFTNRPAAAVCQYDSTRFDKTTLAATVGLHTHRLDAPMLTIRAFEDGLQLTGEADLAAQAELRTALATQPGPVVHLYLNRLRFMDVCCLDEVLTLAHTRQRVVLHDPPRVVLRMLGMLGQQHTLEVRHS